MTKIKAIQTKYDGYHFRSRIEARWAVFFNYLGQPYEYEKEGYDLGDGVWYLCDFWLPRDRVWVEIKGRYPSSIEVTKLRLLSQNTPCRGAYIFYGPIPGKSWFKTWKTISVGENRPRLFPRLSHAQISEAFTAARSARF